MKHTSIPLFLSIVFLSFWPSDIQALPPLPSDIIASTVMLTAKNGQCGTGFVTDEGRVLTNAHVASTLCPNKVCDGVHIRRATGLGRSPDVTLSVRSIHIERIHRAIDMAILATEPALPGRFSLRAIPQPSKEVFSLGFPRCNVLELSEGTIISQDPLRLFSTTKGAHGSSGSPLFNREFHLIGVVHQAGTILGGLNSLLLGNAFENKAIPYSALIAVLNANPQEGWDRSAELILATLSEVAPQTATIDRLRLDLDLISATHGLMDDALSNEVPISQIAPLLFIDRGFHFLSQLKDIGEPGQRRNLAEQLYLAYTLEMRGLYSESFEALSPESLKSQINDWSRTPDNGPRLKSLVEEFERHHYSGLQIAMLSFALPIGIGALLLFFIWSLTLGITFTKSRGKILRRISITILVAIALWPLSYLIFLLKNRPPDPSTP